MREMKDSGIEWLGDIPVGWSTAKLLNILRQPICDGPHETPELINDGGIPFISVDSLNNTKFVDLDVAKKHISEHLYKEYNKKTQLEVGDILFSKAATIGKTAIVDNRKFMVWSPLAVIKVDQQKGYNDYIYYLLNCFELIKHISLLGGYNTQINVGMRALERAVIPIPPMNEQMRIANLLDAKFVQVDALIANQQVQIEKLKQYKQSLTTEVTTKGLDPNALMEDSGVEWIGQVPTTWRIERGKALFQETDARSVDGSEELLTVSQYTGITPRSQKNVNMFEALTLEGYKICEVGDIAANTMWLWAGAIGVSEYRGVISPSYNVYRQKKDNFIPKYLDYLLRAPLLVQEYASRSTGIRASRLRLYPQDFFEILFPIPPKEEQEKIVEFLENKFTVTDQLIAIKEAKIEKLQQYKKSLIYEYVTGKKEVV